MTFLIADTFTAALARLTGPEAAAAKTAAFDLQTNPAAPGLSLHRVERARDPDFWTARASRDLRLVLHKRAGDTALVWVGHHDDAYAWASRRRLETHPTTGAAQIVEIRETVEEIVSRRYVEAAAEAPHLFAAHSDATLLSWGVPPDWLATVRDATEATFLDIAARLPAEAAEALLVAATGGRPDLAPSTTADPFAHPDARRRFRVIGDQAELEAALAAPWEKWAVFLHAAQIEFVTRDFNGPARVIGSAGTGKTVVALHRAVRLARSDPAARVLLTTLNAHLAANLEAKLDILLPPNDPAAERLTVRDLTSAATALYTDLHGAPTLAMPEEVRAALAAAGVGQSLDTAFLEEEWRLVIDAWGVPDAATYRDFPRLGRRQRMPGARRDALWDVFATARASLAAQGRITRAAMFHRLADHFAAAPSPWNHILVDEAQDISIAELRFLASLAGDRPNGLFFAGDIGQRIFRAAFPWKALGVDITGRSRSLKVNYRTSQQIRARSDRLLPARLTESDGAEEDRRGVVSVFEGPIPDLRRFPDPAAESAALGRWLAALKEEGFAPAEIGVLVRSTAEYARAVAALDLAGLGHADLARSSPPNRDKATLATMHEAKGTEFRAIAVMACDAAVIPSEARLLGARDEATLDEIFATERHLLYVAATRARERLWLSGVNPISEFLEDMF
jgi:hypothetical protein